MKLYRIINKSISFIFFLIKYFNIKLAFSFAYYNVPFNITKFIKLKMGKVVFINSNNEINLYNLYKYKKSIVILTKVLNCDKVSIIQFNEDGLIIKFNNLYFNIQSGDNLYTLYEIFIENIYCIKPVQKNCIVIDIGMNVGMASLYFSSLDQILKVYSFEPFKKTFNEAYNNIQLNEIGKKKITLYNLGISDYSGKVKVPSLNSGSAIASTNSLFIEKHNLSALNEVEVEIKNIDEVVEEIISLHPENNIIMKIDCEGEEYAILQSMDSKGYLERVSSILMEWHFKGPEQLINILNKNGFESIHLPKLTNEALDINVQAGMIYAFK